MSRTIVKNWLILFLIISPLVFLLYWITQFAVDTPFWDEWGTVTYLEKSFDGSLTISDLFDQHNESRIFFPRLIMVGLARLTGWNIYYEIGAIVLMALLTFLLLAIQSMRTTIACSGNRPLWLVIFVSALIFTVFQYECWTFGFTLIGYMNIFFTVAGLYLLVSAPFSWIRFACSLLAGTIATYSYANGVCYWIIGLLTLFLCAREQQPRRISPYIIWIIFSALVLVPYFIGYEKPGFSVSFLFFLENPVVFAGYLFSFLGGAIVNIPNIHASIPVAVGVIGLLIFLGSSLACFYLSGRPLKSVALWISLGAYALISALAATLGRSAYGIHQALSSRYTMFSGLFWISTLVISTVVLEYYGRQLRLRSKETAKGLNDDTRKRMEHYLPGNGKKTTAEVLFLSLKTGLVLFTSLCIVFFIISSCYAIKAWKQQYILLRSIRNEFLSFRPDETLLLRSYPVPIPEEWSNFLIRNKLTLFREKKTFADYHLIDGQAGHIESVQGDLISKKVFPAGAFKISGRSYDPEHRQSVRAVLLVNSNRLIIARDDVTFDRDDAVDYPSSSWTVLLQAKKLPVGVSVIDIYALFRDGSCVAQIGAVNLEKVPLSQMKATLQIAFVDEPDTIFGYTDNVYLDKTDYIQCNGWARNPATDEPGQWVIVVNQETNILAYSRITDKREDVAKHFRNKQLLLSGWHVAFNKSVLGPGAHMLKSYLLVPDEKKAFRLNNEIQIVVER